jgi:hypothetical protein
VFPARNFSAPDGLLAVKNGIQRKKLFSNALISLQFV